MILKRLFLFSLLSGAVLVGRWAFLEQLDALLFDLMMRARGPERPDPVVTIVAIDDISLQRIGPWPWPPETLERLFRSIQDHSPAVMGVDLLLNRPFEREPHHRDTPVVLATSLLHWQERGRPRITWHDSERYERENFTLGHVHANKSMDGICRSIPMRISHEGKQRWAFALEVARLSLKLSAAELRLTPESLRLGQIEIPLLQRALDNNLDSRAILPSSFSGDRLIVNFRGPAATFSQIPAVELLAGNGQAAQKLREKIVLVGATAYSLGDHLSTPFGSPSEMPGVEIHANVIDMVLNQRFITAFSELEILELLLCAMVWTWLLFESWTGKWGIYLLAGTLLLAILIPTCSFLWLSHWIPMASMMFAVVLTGTVRQFSHLVSLHKLLNRRFVQLSNLLSSASKPAKDQPRTTASFQSLGLEWKIDLLSEASKEALRHAQTKEEMLFFVSHELKTPLTSLKGFSDLLLEWEQLTPEDRDTSIGLIAAETDRLTEMVGSYLDLARLESGALRLREGLCQVDELVTEAHRQLTTQFEEKRIGLRGRENLDGVVVRGDCNLLRQVFVNLLKNSVKYSPADTNVTLASTQDGSHVEISICDEGYGISSEDQAKLFQKFFRGSTQDENTPGGYGLGLAFVREVVERHQGRVSCESTLGEGSTFRLRLPSM